MEIILAVLAALVVAHNYLTTRSLVASFERERAAARAERQELADRIQAPERIPARLEAVPNIPHFVPDDEAEMAKVGLVLVGGGDDD